MTKIFGFLSTKDSVSISRHGYEVTIPPFWAVFNLSVPEEYKVDEVIDFLDDFHPLVAYAHRNFEVVPLSVPNDSLYFRQESLFDPAGLADINVEQAWETETGKKFIKVGVHDNGVDSLHPDIDVLTGGDYYQNNQAPDWGVEDSGQPHGTQVAGIIGAKRNNEIGITGVAGGDGSDTPGCSLIDFKSPFLTPSNVSYRLASIVDAARSAGSYFDYGDNYHSGGGNDFYFNSAKGFGIHIGNHSYTIRTILPLADQEKTPSGDSSSVINVSECGLCREAYLFSLQNGVINVVARGNSGFDNGDPTYIEDIVPQKLPDGWIISVGASGYDGNTVESGVNQSLSEQNSDFYSLYGGNMDLVAPGSDSIVYSTLTTNVSGLYRRFNGTSAAAPHVSGVAALLLSHYNRPCYSNQNLTVEDVEYLLEKSATDLFDPGFDLKSGAGRLNAGAALEMIKDPTKQIIHPDSLISSVIVQRDTIALAYNEAFVADGWGPISQNIPLEQGREYKVERVFVENTYSFDEYFTPSTILIDSWACPSISNSIEFYRDTIDTVILSQGGIPNDGYIFQLFDSDPFDSIVNVNTTNRTIVVGGYFYKFLIPYQEIFQLDINESSNTGSTTGSIIEENDPLFAVNKWYPFNPESQIPRMVASLYISDSTLTEQYIFPCDSANILADDTTITDPASTNEFEINNFSAQIYPNPGSEAFTIRFSSPEKVSEIIIYSSQGKKIAQIPTKAPALNVNVSSWAKGGYYIKINGDSFSTTLKYLKQ